MNNTPLTDAEIQDLLSTTLHGPLPERTVNRLLATVALVPDLRRRVNTARTALEFLQGVALSSVEKDRKSERREWLPCQDCDASEDEGHMDDCPTAARIDAEAEQKRALVVALCNPGGLP